MSYLADMFDNLAHDPSWPWTIDADTQKRLSIKFNMAKLALIAVSASIEVVGNLADVLLSHHIDPGYYANVKNRVEIEETKNEAQTIY